MAEKMTLERRVSALEEQMNQLSGEVLKNRSKPGWVHKIVGSMENDAEFEEVLKLGREIRASEPSA